MQCREIIVVNPASVSYSLPRPRGHTRHKMSSYSKTSSSDYGESQGRNNAYKIPDELQEVLLDFTVNFLIEQPNDIAAFGISYFTKLAASKREEHNVDNASDDESMLSDEEIQRNGKT